MYDDVDDTGTVRRQFRTRKHIQWFASKDADVAPSIATNLKSVARLVTGFCHRRNSETLDENDPSPASLGDSSSGLPMSARDKTPGYQRILNFLVHPDEADDVALIDSAYRRIQHCMLTDDPDFELQSNLQR